MHIYTHIYICVYIYVRYTYTCTCTYTYTYACLNASLSLSLSLPIYERSDKWSLDLKRKEQQFCAVASVRVRFASTTTRPPSRMFFSAVRVIRILTQSHSKVDARQASRHYDAQSGTYAARKRNVSGK